MEQKLRWKAIVVLAVVLVAGVGIAGAQAEESEGPPLPLHTFEGVGGRPITPTAYLTNPGPEGTTVGKPSVSLQYLNVGGRDMPTAAMTWTLGRRLELGYAVNRLDIRHFSDKMTDGSTDEVDLHNLNARLQLVKENQCGNLCVPAVTVGAHWKYNEGIKEINENTGGFLNSIDYAHNSGLDTTVTASKTVDVGRPLIMSAGIRYGKAAQFGLLGFSDDYMMTMEGNIGVLLTDRLLVGAEVRQQNDQYDVGAGRHQDTWWDVHAGYVLNKNTDIYAVVGDAGSMALDDKGGRHNEFFGAVLKYEF